MRYSDHSHELRTGKVLPSSWFQYMKSSEPSKTIRRSAEPLEANGMASTGKSGHARARVIPDRMKVPVRVEAGLLVVADRRRRDRAAVRSHQAFPKIRRQAATQLALSARDALLVDRKGHA
jgi:hypothetical protein